MAKTAEDLKRLSEEHKDFVSRREHASLHAKIEDDIRLLREAKAQLEGKASQKSVAFSTLLAVSGLVLALLSLLHGLMK